MVPNATIAYISLEDPAYEMSDIRANFDSEMQAFRRGVRFDRLAFLVLTRYRGLQSIAMRSKTILTQPSHLYPLDES